ncbi:hypothetical protein [Marinobacter sp. 2_MG-2023]|uniref:hypothetical protein n=1 Tax=Marinobacter sp. 2_MG-2023 TaxID=3062679 RepID=UPI0026E2F76E|nr:hypothetical protein [Marinobacter sp. 2_MG-2023]MDO6442522.1 hypothetical protein [Marinobacter sp. 2_MG-2023]
MNNINSTEEHTGQLRDVLNIPIIIISLDDSSLSTILDNPSFFNKKEFCIIVSINKINKKKIYKAINLYRTKKLLKNITKKLKNEKNLSVKSIIGIYPSLEYPACVYELHTFAERYVYKNILPHKNSFSKKLIGYLIRKILGFPASIGALGLIINRE